MTGLCAAPDGDLGLVRALLGSVDCNLEVLAQASYGAIARPGSPLAAALTTMLTLYIAFMGFRLMLGLTPLRIGEVTVTVLKIGLILALATNWPTYQQLVLNTLAHGPEQLGTTILQGLQPADGSLAANPISGLQAAYDELQRSAAFYAQHAPAQASPFTGGGAFAAMGLNLSAMLLLLNTIGALLASKIVLAMLLALGPVFVALLLFDATRGLFEGWLRAAVAFAIVPLLSVLGLVVQLTLLEPQLAQLADLREQNMMNSGLASTIFLMAIIFAMVSTAMIVAVGVIAFGFRFPASAALARRAASRASQVPAPARAAGAAPSQPALDSRPERVAQIAMAAAAIQRREDRAATQGSRSRQAWAPAAAGGHAELIQPRASSAGQRRSAQPRRAASSSRRDR